MKRIISLASLLLLFAAVQAQLPDAIAKAKSDVTTAAGSNAGKLLTQLAGAIKPASLLTSFAGQKSGWLAKAGKVTDAVGMAQSLASLAGGIKPNMFKTGFNATSLIQTAGTVKTLTDAAGMAKNLEGGLKPEALTSAWTTQKPAWESALSLLK